MYVKLMQHLNKDYGVTDKNGRDNCLVVPSRNIIIECTDVQYEKVRFTTEQELLNSFGSFIYFGESKKVAYKGNPLNEAVLVKILKSNNCWDYYLCGDCDIFVMNSEGKTIDTIRI